MTRLFYRAVFVLAVMLTAGCAANNPKDPAEPFNRAMFSFNEQVDRTVLRPVATGYKAVTPQPARTAVGNFFGNIGDVWSTVNAGLQLKPEKFLTGVFRVGINTIFGIGGILDIASEAGLNKPQEDFGQTLGYWGVKPGMYLVWPFFGPSNVRDTVGLGADWFGTPLAYVDPASAGFIARGVDVVDQRARLLGADQVLDEAALDKYTFVRDGYLQRRQNLIYDGNPPQDDGFEPDDGN